MRILKWLFHPVNLFIIIVLVALYINRQTIFSELSESPEVRQINDKVDAVIEQLDEERAVAESGVVVEADDEKGVADTGDEHGQPAQAETYQQLPEMHPVEGDDVTAEKENIAADEAVAADMPVTAPEKEEPVVAAEVTPPREEEAMVSDPGGASEIDPLMLWQSARRSAWDGDADKAIQDYRALIALQPKNYDAYGELGNVLLQKGDIDAAVDAYSQAAILISQSRYPQVAWRVVEIVSQLDQHRAQQLYQEIREQQLGRAGQN